jgi:hypothetical protein
MAGQLPIYLVDFSCFAAPDELKVDYNKSQEAAWRWKVGTGGAGGISAVQQSPQALDIVISQLNTLVALRMLRKCALAL